MAATLPVSVPKSLRTARLGRKKRFEALLATLPDTPHPSLSGHQLVDTENLFDVKVLSLHKFRHLYDHLVPVPVQRDHLRRIARGEVGYLLEPHLTHVQYVVVVDPEDGAAKTADGNTRTALYFLEDSKVVCPSHVAVLVLYPDNAEMLEDVYFCIDSQVNSKRTRHDITSFMRDALGGTLDVLEDSESACLVRDAHLVSAFKRLARVWGIGALQGRNARANLKQVTIRCTPHLVWLSQFELKPKELTQGVIGACLWLKSQLGDDAQELELYLNELRNSVDGIKPGTHPVIREYHETVAEAFTRRGKKFGSENAQDVMFGLTYDYFNRYLKAFAVKAGAADRKRLTALAGSLHSLPQHFEKKVTKALTA